MGELYKKMMRSSPCLDQQIFLFAGKKRICKYYPGKRILAWDDNESKEILILPGMNGTG